MAERSDVEGLGTGAVVVGIDGSDGARTALATALREGALRGLPVVVVWAYDPPDLWGPEGAGLIDAELIERELRRSAERTVEEVTRELHGDGVTVPATRVVVAPGGAASVLSLVAQGAQLLVVGHRGRGALATRLIGSVGLGVVVHAPCAVLVVREHAGRSAVAEP